MRSANPQGAGDILMFSYIPRTQYLLGPSTYVGSRHFWGVQNFEFQYFWGFQKMNIFLGMMILWIFLGGHHKIGLY